MPIGNGLGVGKRGGQPCGQKPGAGGGFCPVDDRQQAAALFPGQGLAQFEISPGGRVDGHERRRGLSRWRLQVGSFALLGQFEIADQCPRRRQFGAGEVAEAGQRRHPIIGFQGSLARLRIEHPAWLNRNGPAKAVGNQVLGFQILGQQQLARRQTRQLHRQILGFHRRQRKSPRRHVGGRDRQGPARAAQRRQSIGVGRIEQRFLGQCAGGNQTDDLAFDHRFGPTLLGLGGVFHLLANGHAKALANQLFQILLGGVDRHAAHWDVFAKMLAAFGQRDVEGFGRLGGILEKQLVEIAHPIKQQISGILGFDFQKLRHNRRGAIVCCLF